MKVCFSEGYAQVTKIDIKSGFQYGLELIPLKRFVIMIVFNDTRDKIYIMLHISCCGSNVGHIFTEQ